MAISDDTSEAAQTKPPAAGDDADRDAPRSARRGWMAGALVAVLLASALGARALLAGDDGADDAPALLGSGWTEIPEAPLAPRSGAGVVWAGDRLVVWSGVDPRSTSLLTDGAVWRPEAGWSPMSAPPLDVGLAAGEGFALWTGSEVVFGPLAMPADSPASTSPPDMLAYDPVRDRWRGVVLSPEPLHGWSTEHPQSRAIVVGAEIVLAAHGNLEGSVLAGLLVVDPATGTARALDPGPLDESPYADASGDVALTVVGQRLVAVPNWAAEVWVLDPAGPGTWHRAADPPAVSQLHLNPPVGADGEALFLEEVQPLAYDPAADRWRMLAPPFPGAERVPARIELAPRHVWAGRLALGVGEAYDPATDTWALLEQLPIPLDIVISQPYVGSTGDGLVVFGGGRYECPLNAMCDVDPSDLDWTPNGWYYLL